MAPVGVMGEKKTISNNNNKELTDPNKKGKPGSFKILLFDQTKGTLSTMLESTQMNNRI